MADTKDEGKNEPVNDTQDAPMPSADQKTPDTGGQEASQPKGEASVPEQPPASDLPDSATERTREQFDKLKEQLREEREARKRVEGLFSTMAPQPQPQPQTPQVTPVYDPETGLLNEDALGEMQKGTFEANERAARAEAAAARTMQELENRELYSAYPELKPGKDQDKELFTEARRIIRDSVFNPEDYGLDPQMAGQGLTPKQAADLARERIPKKEVKQEPQSQVQDEEPKEQATLEATGSPQRANELESVEEEELARASRLGRPGAMAARLAARRKKSTS